MLAIRVAAIGMGVMLATLSGGTGAVASTAVSPAEVSLLQQAASGSPNTRRTAFYLLGELALTAGAQKRLERACARMHGLDALFCSYALYRTTQDARWLSQFVNAFPDREKQAALWSAFESGTQLRSAANVLDLLIESAFTNDRAAVALIQLMNTADGFYAQVVMDGIGRMARHNRSRTLHLIETAALADDVRAHILTQLEGTSDDSTLPKN